MRPVCVRVHYYRGSVRVLGLRPLLELDHTSHDRFRLMFPVRIGTSLPATLATLKSIDILAVAYFTGHLQEPANEPLIGQGNRRGQY